MTKNALLYARSSNLPGSNITKQLDELRALAARRGLPVIAVYSDQPDLDAKHRPGMSALCKHMAQDIDVVLMSCLADIAASVDDIVTFVAKLHAAKVDLILSETGIDTTQPDGLVWKTAMLTLDKHQRLIKAERASLGRQRAMKAGVKFGRPQVSETKLQAVREALGAGAGIRPAARLTGVSPAKVFQVKREMLEVQPSN